MAHIYAADFIIRYEGDEVIGIITLHASKR
jgi:hypothetical protein